MTKKKVRKLSNKKFTAFVENKKTGKGYGIQIEPERFSLLPADAPIRVFECTSIQHMPERCFTKFNYRKRLFIRGVMEIIRETPRVSEYWWHQLVR